jgi:hypothetical protein
VKPTIPLALLLCASISQAASKATPPSVPMQLGVTTHFSQGWPIALLNEAKALGVTSIRDSLHWAVIENAPGRYSFTDANTRHITRACDMGMKVMLGIDPRNRIYDKGATAHSSQARNAFAAYILAIADRFPTCVIAVEIGNEINGRNGMTGAATINRATSHKALLRAVYERVKPTHPDLKLLGGSTNVVGTGFLETLFGAGALAYMDGVVVHPYRNEPEAVEWELARLQAAMERTGNFRPIWANEFSRDFADPAEGPDFFLKMFALMGGAGISDAYWYALVDQKWYPTMGLLTQNAAHKPVASAFAYAARNLAPLGRPDRVDVGDPAVFHYRFGSNRQVIWGTRRKLNVSGIAVFRRSNGAPAAQPGELSGAPMIIEGPATLNLGPAEVLADSRYGFGRSPLSYHIYRQTGGLSTLEPIDWNWGSYLGSRAVREIQVNSTGIGPARGGATAVNTIIRYTATSSLQVVASLCLSPLLATGDGVSISIAHNGNILWRGDTSHKSGVLIAQTSTKIKPGDFIDFSMGPNANAVGDRMRYHYRISRTAKDVASC